LIGGVYASLFLLLQIRSAFAGIAPRRIDKALTLRAFVPTFTLGVNLAIKSK
jgi:hypothetical protein